MKKDFLAGKRPSTKRVNTASSTNFTASMELKKKWSASKALLERNYRGGKERTIENR